MKVYVTRKRHGNDRYLLNWANPDTGSTMGQWFQTMRELKDYIHLWDATIVFTAGA